MTKTLTGRTRFNIHKRWFGTDLVTLQVEEIESDRENLSKPDRSYFRDATLFDIQELELIRGAIYEKRSERG